MSNISLVAKMNGILDTYEQGKVRPEDVESFIHFHMDAMEAIPYQQIKDADHLCYRLVSAHVFAGTEEFVDTELVSTVLADFRAFFSSLLHQTQDAS